MVKIILSAERFDREKIKSAIKHCIDAYNKEREVNPNITSGEMTNKIILEGLTMAEVEEVYNYFYNGVYPDYNGYDYKLW